MIILDENEMDENEEADRRPGPLPKRDPERFRNEAALLADIGDAVIAAMNKKLADKQRPFRLFGEFLEWGECESERQYLLNVTARNNDRGCASTFDTYDDMVEAYNEARKAAKVISAAFNASELGKGRGSWGVAIRANCYTDGYGHIIEEERTTLWSLYGKRIRETYGEDDDFRAVSTIQFIIC